MKTIGILLFVLALLGSGCKGKQQNTQKDKAEGMKGGPAWSLGEQWKSDTLMRTCESVRYDAGRKQLFVSCIDGEPWEKDGVGFIALMNLDGSIKTEHWITGLDAPKGIGIYEGSLYVTDIDQLVVIDIENAAIREKIPVPGAAQLNDVAVSKDGKVYFSDSETGWIWTLDNGKPVQWQGGFERPNGLYVEDNRVLLASSGSQDLKSISLEDGSQEQLVDEIGYGDGLEFTGVNGYYLVTSWEGEIFLVLPDQSRISLLKTSDQGINSADIGFNVAEQIVYVPTFFKNRVVAYKLVPAAD